MLYCCNFDLNNDHRPLNQIVIQKRAMSFRVLCARGILHTTAL